jgi:hypothetical protein
VKGDETKLKNDYKLTVNGFISVDQIAPAVELFSI